MAGEGAPDHEAAATAADFGLIDNGRRLAHTSAWMEALPLDKEATVAHLSDKDAVQLAGLLLAYFMDCREIDPGTPQPDALTAEELLDDLASSTSGPEQRQIEALWDAIRELFAGRL